MVECIICSTMVTKNSPGLQCNNCLKWIHGSCANLSTEQLSALYSIETADWKCRACAGDIKPKRLSFILPDAEEVVPVTNLWIQASPSRKQKMLNEIHRQVYEIVHNELDRTLQIYSDKVNEYNVKIKEYENQCNEIRNTCKNLSLRNAVLEQKVNIIEQNMIKNYIEICGIKFESDEDVMAMIKNVGKKINMNTNDIIKVYRKPFKSSSKQTPIVVSLREGCRDKWIEAAKNTLITAKDIGVKEEYVQAKIYIRESLTPNTAFLLWKTKMALKQTGKYKIWCKNGVVMARCEENGTLHMIKSNNDIERLESEH